MDAQYPFASRDDIWRVLEELKELQVAQFDQAERLARLERRRDGEMRLKSLWSPQSPFPPSVGGSIAPGLCCQRPMLVPFTDLRCLEPAFNSPPDAFKGFDQGQHHGMSSSGVGIETEDEPRRGASRANSVRFDESANYGYYGQANRSSTELPLRAGSGMGSHPLTERSLSHRSDGRQSSSGFSHHSARTNSLGLDTRGLDTSGRLMGSSFTESPLIPPPGLFLLGPVPCIIRCWLTEQFSNESLLYAAVCSGSSVSSLGTSVIAKLGLEDSVMHDWDRPYIKLPLYLPEASVHQSSSRSASPESQLPTLKIRFLVRETNAYDESIQIVLGSDVLRAHNADIMFSQDKINMVDSERNRVSIPLVRPEKDSVFRLLCTVPDTTHPDFHANAQVNGHSSVGAVGQPSKTLHQSTSAPASTRVSVGEADEGHKPRLQEPDDTPKGDTTSPTTVTSDTSIPTSKPEAAGVWGSWRRDSKTTTTTPNTTGRNRMTVLRPAKASTRAGSSTSTPTSATVDHGEPNSQPDTHSTQTVTGKSTAPNPVGGASAFGWLNPASSAPHVTRQS